MEATPTAVHRRHIDKDEQHSDCPECIADAETLITAVDWISAVRQFGIEAANRMFP